MSLTILWSTQSTEAAYRARAASLSLCLEAAYALCAAEMMLVNLGLIATCNRLLVSS